MVLYQKHFMWCWIIFFKVGKEPCYIKANAYSEVFKMTWILFEGKIGFFLIYWDVFEKYYVNTVCH